MDLFQRTFESIFPISQENPTIIRLRVACKLNSTEFENLETIKTTDVFFPNGALSLTIIFPFKLDGTYPDIYDKLHKLLKKKISGPLIQKKRGKKTPKRCSFVLYAKTTYPPHLELMKKYISDITIKIVLSKKARVDRSDLSKYWDDLITPIADVLVCNFPLVFDEKKIQQFNTLIPTWKNIASSISKICYMSSNIDLSRIYDEVITQDSRKDLVSLFQELYLGKPINMSNLKIKIVLGKRKTISRIEPITPIPSQDKDQNNDISDSGFICADAVASESSLESLLGNTLSLTDSMSFDSLSSSSLDMSLDSS